MKKYLILILTLVSTIALSANVKITQLPALSAVDWATGDVFEIVDVSASTSKKTSIGDFDLRYAPTARIIATTAPLSGGGDLSANRTLSIANSAADGTTKGAAAFTASDFDAASGVVSLDYTNGQAASASNKGYLTSADWTTFNAKQAALGYTPANTSLSNLGTTAANQSINPASDGDFDLGAYTNAWNIVRAYQLRSSDDTPNLILNSRLLVASDGSTLALDYSTNGILTGAQLKTNDGADGVMFGSGADGSTGGTAFGNNAIATAFGTAIGNSADGHTYGVAIGVHAQGVEGIGIGDSANGSSFGIAVGNSSNGSSGGLAFGAGSDGSASGVAIGNSARGANSAVAIGANANADPGGIAVGVGAYAANGGIAVGLLANGPDGGTAIGLFSHGETTGVGIGQSAHGETNGVSIGSSSLGSDQGVAIGAGSIGDQYGVGIGYSANGKGVGNAAIGGDDSGSLPAAIPFGWTDTVELGRGTATLQGGLNFRGFGIVDSKGGVHLVDYTSISSPTEGTMAWNYTTHKQMIYNGSSWETVTSL